MIRLSDRLQIIADRIENSETMADIGTDHGFLPIYLWETGECSKVILTDISTASLEKSRENYRRLMQSSQDGCRKSNGAGEGVFFRTGNGLKVLDPCEVDAVVIAGMGGKLIRDIMAEDISLTCSFKKFILQPRIGQGELRKWLIDNGFIITGEDLVKEGDYIPEIITVLSPAIPVKDDKGKSFPSDKSSQGFVKGKRDEGLSTDDFGEIMEGEDKDSVVFRIPPWIINAGGPVEEFLSRNISKDKKILERVMLSKKRNMLYEQQICDNIYYMKNLLKEYRHGKQYKKG